ncbi:MAG: hypothetical protein KA716_14045 [Gloeotrichia echinulata DEX184]|nr:hypothetical protein [Gloeotrichia echinulata DEX184]
MAQDPNGNNSLASSTGGLDDLLRGCLDAVDKFGFKDGVGGGIFDDLKQFDENKSVENWGVVVTKLKDIEQWWGLLGNEGLLGNVDKWKGEDILLFKDFKDFIDVSKKITDEFSKAASTKYQPTSDDLNWFSQLKIDADNISQQEPISIDDTYNKYLQKETIEDVGKDDFTFDLKKFNDLLNHSISAGVKAGTDNELGTDDELKLTTDEKTDLQNFQSKITQLNSTNSTKPLSYYLALNTLVNSLSGSLKETVKGWISHCTQIEGTVTFEGKTYKTEKEGDREMEVIGGPGNEYLWDGDTFVKRTREIITFPLKMNQPFWIDNPSPSFLANLPAITAALQKLQSNGQTTLQSQDLLSLHNKYHEFNYTNIDTDVKWDVRECDHLEVATMG